MNSMDLFKNMGNIQEKLRESQEKLKSITAQGTAGGDMVKVILNGEMFVLSVEISPDVVDPGDISMLQDLVVAAHADAMARIREKIHEELGSLTGGLNLPPGFMG